MLFRSRKVESTGRRPAVCVCVCVCLLCVSPGGWYCFNKENCDSRYETMRRLMSSSKWPQTKTGQTRLETDPKHCGPTARTPLTSHLHAARARLHAASLSTLASTQHNEQSSRGTARGRVMTRTGSMCDADLHPSDEAQIRPIPGWLAPGSHASPARLALIAV